MNLTTAQRVKAILADGVGPKEDALLDQLIVAASAMAESYMRRTAATGTYTEYFDVRALQRHVQLKAFPLTSITSVYNDSARSYGSETLLASTGYAAQLEDGRLCFDYYLTQGLRALKVTYVGGMAATADAFVTAYPDIAHAVEMQVVHEFRRRKDAMDGSSASLGVGSFLPVGSVTLLSYTKDILDRYARMDVAQ